MKIKTIQMLAMGLICRKAAYGNARTQINIYNFGGALLGVLLMRLQGPMLDAVMIILFIRLWTELTLERFPLGLWRKSCDHHWHLMNDHNDRDYHL